MIPVPDASNKVLPVFPSWLSSTEKASLSSLVGVAEKIPGSRNGFPVGADLRVRPVVDADLVEVFLPFGDPALDIRSICELRV